MRYMSFDYQRLVLGRPWNSTTQLRPIWRTWRLFCHLHCLMLRASPMCRIRKHIRRHRLRTFQRCLQLASRHTSPPLWRALLTWTNSFLPMRAKAIWRCTAMMPIPLAMLVMWHVYIIRLSLSLPLQLRRRRCSIRRLLHWCGQPLTHKSRKFYVVSTTLIGESTNAKKLPIRTTTSSVARLTLLQPPLTLHRMRQGCLLDSLLLVQLHGLLHRFARATCAARGVGGSGTTRKSVATR